MVEDLGAADGGGRRGFQAELRPRKAEESVPALLAATKEIKSWSVVAEGGCGALSGGSGGTRGRGDARRDRPAAGARKVDR